MDISVTQLNAREVEDFWSSGLRGKTLQQLIAEREFKDFKGKQTRKENLIYG